MKKIILLLSLAIVILATGCGSKTLYVRTPPANFSTSCKSLGEVEGTGGGLLLWALVPLGVNGRFDRAYQEALDSVGATHLTDVKVVDHWYYIPFLGIALSARTEGKAIQCPGFKSEPIKKERRPK